MANVLPKAKQVTVIRALVDGVSVRATERITNTSRETVFSLLVRVGEGCAALHDRVVRDLACERIECHTRLTNAFSKKLRNHKAATALFVAHYNLVRSHRSIRMTPAMAASVSDHAWELEELVDAALANPEAA